MPRPVTVSEFRSLVLDCGFLLDWQKRQVLSVLNAVGGGIEYGKVLSVKSVMPVVDNVLRRTQGVSLASLPVLDRLAVEYAIHEAVSE